MGEEWAVEAQAAVLVYTKRNKVEPRLKFGFIVKHILTDVPFYWRKNDREELWAEEDQEQVKHVV